MIQEKHAQCYVINPESLVVIGPVKYTYYEGTSFIIDYNELVGQQFPEAGDIKVLRYLDILKTSFYTKNLKPYPGLTVANGFITTRFVGGSNPLKVFCTSIDRPLPTGQMAYERFYTATYTGAVAEHLLQIKRQFTA